jgi:histone deacetylase HOS3
MANSPPADMLATSLAERVSPANVPLPPTPATTSEDSSRRLAHSLRSPSPRKARPSIPASTPSRKCSNNATSSRSPQSTRKQSKEPSQAPANPSPSRSASGTSNIVSADDAPRNASAIALEYFTKELAYHKNSDARTLRTDTAVIIHDACYGHRFSRPKTTKTHLSLIVERPERVQAVIRGISSAYVRLGGSYADGLADVSRSTNGSNSSSIAVPFTISRSSRAVSIISPVVTNVHGVKWMQELKTMCEAAGSRLATGQKEMARVEDPGSPASKPHLHEGDLYLCSESLDAFQGALGGVLDAVDQVFQEDVQGTTSTIKKAFVCVRPPGHHCSADMPSGFCWLNNVHVGIEHAAQAYGLTHAAIIDFDLHHGDGSQAITWERNTKAWKMAKNISTLKKTGIGYFSLHDINSYPCEDGEISKVQAASLCVENAHGQTVWNVHLQPWKTEAEFWELYKSRYSVLLEKTRQFLQVQTQRVCTAGNVQPKGAIFISAGFDASEYEGEGMQRHKVNVPTEFYARFTSDIVKLAEEEGLSTEGRVISVLEGGYSDRALASGTLGHLVGLAGVPDAINKAHMRRTSLSNLNGQFPTAWWNTLAMTELEALVDKSRGLPVKRSRTSDITSHATPTESFLAKIIDPSKLWRGPAPPAPIVDWATAAFELSKLLIPSDRQVNSHRPEDLSEPRVKKERAPSTTTSVEPTGEGGRTLRGRKPKEAAVVAAAPATLPIRNAKSNRKSTEGVVTPRMSLPNTEREGSADMEQLTASVRKITLKLSDKDKHELQKPANSTNITQTKPLPKKAPIGRAGKTITPKSSTLKMSRNAKSTPATPASNISTSSSSSDFTYAGIAAARALSERAQELAAQNSLAAQTPVRAIEHEHVHVSNTPAYVGYESKLMAGSNASDAGSMQTVAQTAPLNFNPMTTNPTSAAPVNDLAPKADTIAQQFTAPAQTAGVGGNVFNPQQAATQVEQIKLLPTNATASSPPKVQAVNKPPVFTSHGHIPFGMPAVIRPAVTAPVQNDGMYANNTTKKEDIWEIPDTPQR